MAQEDRGSRLDRWRTGEGAEEPLRRAEQEPPVSAQDEDEAEDLGDPRKYRAYHTRSRSFSLEIRRVLAAWHSPDYSHYYNLSRNANYGDNFVIYYSFMMVEVEGKNLQQVARAIIERRCQWIQDFHAEEHDPPAEGEPVITSIAIRLLKDFVEELSEADKRHTRDIMDARARGRPGG
jgi:hypothetical protein